MELVLRHQADQLKSYLDQIKKVEMKNLNLKVEEKVKGRRRNEISTNSSTYYLTVASGKGGVGKSSLTINLALYWKSLGKRVLVFDGDFGLANLHILLNEKINKSFNEVREGRKDLKEVIQTTRWGIDLIIGSSGELKLAEISAGELWMILLELKKISGYDRVIIDLGAGISENLLTLIDASDRLLLTCTPEPTSILDGYGLMKTLDESQIKTPIEVIFNRSISKKISLMAFSSLEATVRKYLWKSVKSVELLGLLPQDEELVHSIYRKQPLFYLNSKSSFVKSLIELARQLEKKIDEIKI